MDMKLEIVKKNPVSILEKIYAILTLFIMTRPLWRQMVVGGIDIQFYLVVVLFLAPLLFVLKRPGRFAWIVSRDKILLFLIVFVIFSVVWSSERSETIKGVITLIGGTFFGVYLAMRYSVREQMQVLLWVFILIAVVSLIVIVVSPSVGIHVAGGRSVWVGVFDQKNGLGRYMAISAVLSWIMITDSKRKLFLWGNFFLAMILVLMARSATSLIVVPVTISFLPILRVWKWRNFRALPGIFILGLLLISFLVILLTDREYAGLDWFFTMLGRNLDSNTLKVRIALWNGVLESALRHPWLGVGYGNTSVFDALDSVALFGTEWLPEHAHNGFLDIFVQLGLVGLGAMLLHVVVGFRRALLLARLTKTNESLWVLAYLTILLLFSITYSIYLGQYTAPWSIYVALTLSVCFQLSRMEASSKNPVMINETMSN